MEDDWQFALHWIIVRQVRKRLDKRYMFAFPNCEVLPDSFYHYYSENECYQETHLWGTYWTKTNEKIFMAKLMQRFVICYRVSILRKSSKSSMTER